MIDPDSKSPLVLITGTSTGFGRNAVTLFLKKGWRVIATLRNSETRTHLFAEEIQNYPNQLQVVTLDVTSPDEIQKILRFIENEEGGRLDCLINNAGYGVVGALEDLDEAQIRRQMEVNFFGLILLTQALLPALKKNHGRIINVSSVLGMIGMPLLTLYCASKYALEGFSESLSHELKPWGVQVSLVEPGGYPTEFGNSLQWGVRSFLNSSPYSGATLRYQGFKSRLARPSRRPSPAQVAETLVHLAEMKKMPLRVRCGKDTKAVYWLKRLLPERTVVWTLGLAYRRAYYSTSV